MPYNPKKNGAANYKSWMQLTDSQISAIEAIEGADNTASPNDERFASMVHVVNAIPLEVQDIQIGAVELKNATTDDRVNVELDSTKNAVYVQSESLATEATVATLATEATVSTLATEATVSTLATEATVSTLASESTLATIAESVQTPDEVAGTRVVQMGGIASGSTPTEVSIGDAVKLALDTLGRIFIKGYNSSLDSIDVNMISHPLLSRLGPVINIDAAVNDVVGAWIDVSNYHNMTIHIHPSTDFGDSSEAATVYVNHSLDGVKWVPIDSAVINSDKAVEISLSNIAYKYINTSIEYSVSSVATITTSIYAGN